MLGVLVQRLHTARRGAPMDLLELSNNYESSTVLFVAETPKFLLSVLALIAGFVVAG